MDIYERLETDHDRQRDLVRRLAETSGDSADRRELWNKFKTELEAHANAEEQVFYAELIAHPDTQEKARHSVAEHKEAADLLEELDDMDMSSSGWLTRFKTLGHDVVHHVDEEEDEVFPKARKVISEAKAQSLAADFDERKMAEA